MGLWMAVGHARGHKNGDIKIFINYCRRVRVKRGRGVSLMNARTHARTLAHRDSRARARARTHTHIHAYIHAHI